MTVEEILQLITIAERNLQNYDSEYLEERSALVKVMKNLHDKGKVNGDVQ